MSQFLRLISDLFQSEQQAEDKIMQQFDQLLEDQGGRSRITFASLVLNTSPTSPNDIREIGLSIWTRQSLAYKSSYHWCIQEHIETKDFVEFGKPDSFHFGSTHPIKKEDVKVVLDDWGQSLAERCDQLCVVSYGKQTITNLRRHWKPPVPLVFIDLEVILRLRLCGADQSTALEDVASAVSDVINVTTKLDHAGNQAHWLLCLMELMVLNKSQDKLALKLGGSTKRKGSEDGEPSM